MLVSWRASLQVLEAENRAAGSLAMTSLTFASKPRRVRRVLTSRAWIIFNLCAQVVSSQPCAESLATAKVRVR